MEACLLLTVNEITARLTFPGWEHFVPLLGIPAEP